MQFRLTYRGPLSSNGRPLEKQALRRHFHAQLKVLWDQPPLSTFGRFLQPADAENTLSVLRELGPFAFAPLVCNTLGLVAELDITFLRPGAPGDLVRQGGDIDNRMKTLLDALSVPPHLNQIPDGDQPTTAEVPLFCLLGDDGLITRLGVEADRLLDPTGSTNEVALVVRVTTKQVRTMIGTIGLA
jgi:hypothetical protein